MSVFRLRITLRYMNTYLSSDEFDLGREIGAGSRLRETGTGLGRCNLDGLSGPLKVALSRVPLLSGLTGGLVMVI